MIKLHIRFVILVFLTQFYCFIGAEEFVYPVAVLDNNPEQIYLIYQKSLDHIELWSWNSRTKQARQALLTTWIPAGLKMLPDNSGFSFMHHGRLRIKYFHKRSPRSISIYDPIYDDIGSIEWLDNKRFYGHGRLKMYEVFQSNLFGEVRSLVGRDGYDCMYPQIVNSQLFYIQRSSDGGHTIMVAPYQEDNLCTDNRNSLSQRLILDVGKRSIAFLHMMCESQGFFIEHPAAIPKNSKFVSFSCYSLFIDQVQGGWTSRKMFNFQVPTRFLLGNTSKRVYEAPLPFLPRYAPNGKIYYVSCNSSGSSLYEFDMVTAKNIKIIRRSRGILLSPLPQGQEVFYGGILKSSTKNSKQLGTVRTFVDKYDATCFIIPHSHVKVD